MIGRKKDGSVVEVEVDRGAMRARSALGTLDVETFQAWIINLGRGSGMRDAKIAKTLGCSVPSVRRWAKRPIPDLAELLKPAAE